MNPASSTCPLCSHNALSHMECSAADASAEGQTVSIRTCPGCHFAWQWPLERTAQQSSAFFQAEYEGERKSSYFDKELRSKISQLQLDFLAELGIEQNTLIDIGCGDGTFATEAAKKGWKALGLDPAIPPGMQEKAALVPNLHLMNGTMDGLDPRAKFMCVTLWDVVEHLPDPEPVLKKAWDLLAPGGWLVLETGNYQSAERLLSGRHWWAWQLDHRWYFSPATLLQLLKPFQYAESRLAKRVFRPWSSGSVHYRPPSRLQTLLSVLKRPWRTSKIIQEHATKRYAASTWPEWAGLPIFTLAIKK